jgi:hypothetical protein
MSFVAPVLVVFALSMAAFTDPQSTNTIWIAVNQIVALVRPIDCAQGAHTKIVTENGSFCVLEDPASVKQRMEEAVR